MPSILRVIILAALSGICFGYAEFGDLTRPPTVVYPEPTAISPPRISDDTFVQHAMSYAMVTAVAPSITLAANGSLVTSWSIHQHRQFKRSGHHRGILRRQGVFSGDSSYAVTCTPCTKVNTTTNPSSTCRSTPYSGVFQNEYTASNTWNICYGSSYAGALSPVATSTSIPCCPSCTPPTNSTMPITTGILGTTTLSNMTTTTPTTRTSTTSTSTDTQEGVTTITTVTSLTVTISETSSVVTTVISTPTIISGTSTTITSIETITSSIIVTSSSSPTPTTPSQGVTIGITTVTPKDTITSGTLLTTVLAATVSGCGTASGSGTVVGSGTVYIGPYGLIPVASVGTASGSASKVVGCGYMIATSGVFTGSASITGCGEGSGSATLTGSGTVYPAILGGLIPIVSSGTISGSGRVVGCGTLTGSGTFTVSSTMITTYISSTPRPIVEVYISYCPTTEPLFHIAANASNPDSSLSSSGPFPHPLGRLAATHPPFLSVDNSTATNGTNSTTSDDNPHCHICPNDSGICCPPYSACGADGHCPYIALVGCGYVQFGINIVDDRNSSPANGMKKASWSVAPGLPGNDTSGGELKRSVMRKPKKRERGIDRKERKKGNGHRHAHGYGHQHGQGV